jgi:L-histidine N-alpha-methyltransferase
MSGAGSTELSEVDGAGTEAGAGEGETEALLDELWQGLNADPPHVSSRFFYDRRGSELFEAITRLPEYYPTRTERALLTTHADEIVERAAPASILELGAGSASKTRILLDAVGRARGEGHYLPQDVSGAFLEGTARELRGEYPWLRVTPLVGDLRDPVALPDGVERPLLLAFLGSTIGNFTAPQAGRILSHVADALAAGDSFLLGMDLRPSAEKSLEELEAAYNDSRGITADFNRNALRVLNHRAGTDFDVDAWEHRAFYDAHRGRIEMHLVATAPEKVSVPERGVVHFARGEHIRTEISAKYDREVAGRMLRGAGMTLEAWFTDRRSRYALALARRG